MSDHALLGIVLFVGGVAYLAIFMWITRARVKDLGPDKKPNQGAH